MTILYVEDDLLAHRMMSRITALLGYECLMATSGAQALELSKQCPNLDLVIVDWQLPDINGLDLARNIHNQMPTIPIIVITGVDIQQKWSEWLLAGCVTYLVKPVDVGTLIATLKRYSVF